MKEGASPAEIAVSMAVWACWRTPLNITVQKQTDEVGGGVMVTVCQFVVVSTDVVVLVAWAIEIMVTVVVLVSVDVTVLGVELAKKEGTETRKMLPV